MVGRAEEPFRVGFHNPLPVGADFYVVYAGSEEPFKHNVTPGGTLHLYMSPEDRVDRADPALVVVRVRRGGHDYLFQPMSAAAFVGMSA